MAIHLSRHSATRASCFKVNRSIRDIANLLGAVFPLNRYFIIPLWQSDRRVFVVDDPNSVLAHAQVEVVTAFKNLGLFQVLNLVTMTRHFSISQNPRLSYFGRGLRNGLDPPNQYVALSVYF